MTLTVGTRLGVYEILAPIGAGGMGEVYKGRDTKLGREVAIKVLPEEFAEDKERLARFEREARLLASLNHPNIATLFDLQESKGVHFLVLEFVPGETLAERIAKGQTPTEEALPLFKQIAEALEAAHEQGVIHRDLKPANIKVTPEGKIKVLDFGLAKAFGDESAATDSSQSPTMTRDATRAGVILGTASYMSPEQARGKSVDRRSDIWAFACCLYETLTGQKVFAGETVTDIFAAVVKNDPDWNRLPSTVPWKIRELLRRCLRKDANRRLHHVGDARADIEEALSEPSQISPATAKSTGRAVFIAAAVAALAAGIVVWALTRPSRSPPRPMQRLSIVIPPNIELLTGIGPTIGPTLVISPDSSKIAYLGVRDGIRQIYVRAMDQIEAAPLRGTEGASQLFISSDSQWLGFFAEGQLKKAPLASGPPVTLCEVGNFALGASWVGDEIVFGSSITGLSKVSAAGGEPQELTGLDSGEAGHRWPEILPGGKAVLFTSWLTTQDNARVAVQSLETGVRRILVEESIRAHYTSSSHIVFTREDSLHAVPFDLERLELTGPSVPVLEGVLMANYGWSPFSLSADGILTYIPADTAVTANRKPVWVGRNGTEQVITDAVMGSFVNPRLSPDGERLALSTNVTPDIWILELARGTMTRFTFGEGLNVAPIWSPDGRRIFFTSNRNEADFSIFSKPTDGSGAVEQLTSGAYRVPSSVSSDGKRVIFRQRAGNSSWDIGMIRLDGNREIEMLLQSAFDEHTGKLSPDDRWLAYVSNESGREEIYVQPFPGPGRIWQVSTEGGTEPLWAENGNELFYRNGEKMMAVAIRTEPEFAPGRPSLLFEGDYIYGRPTPYSEYSVTSDGQRFVMIKETGESSTPGEITVILNWNEELKRLAPTN